MPFALAHLVPAELRDVLLDCDWDRVALHALELPVEDAPVDELRWQLDLPWWRDGERTFAITPNQVRAGPERFAAQWRRTLGADLAFPIQLAETRPARWTILDGVHRLLKADVLGHTHIRAMRLDAEALSRVIAPV